MSDAAEAVGVLLLIALGILLLPVILGVAVLVLLGYWFYKADKKRKASREAERAEAARVAAFQASAGCPRPDGSLWVPGTGSEVFTPDKLLIGQVYRVTVVGKLFHPCGAAVADALYERDRYGNLSVAHHRFRLDGAPITNWDHHRTEHDRASNRYVFHVDGTGENLSLALVCPSDQAQGGVFVKVERPPEPVSSPAEEHRRAEQRAARQQRSAEVQEKVAGLVLLGQTLRNWADPAFRESKGLVHTDRLLCRRNEIARAYITLHTQDPEATRILHEQHPAAYNALVGELEAYLAAERHEVTRALAPPPPPRRRKPTPEQVRDRIVRRELTVAEDERAVLDAAAGAYEKKAATLRDRGLDEDEIAQVLGPKSEVLTEAQDRLVARKGGNHAGLATLA